MGAFRRSQTRTEYGKDTRIRARTYSTRTRKKCTRTRKRIYSHIREKIAYGGKLRKGQNHDLATFSNLKK